MMGFEKISATELENAIESIGSKWMLITVEDKAQGRVNAMTASWGAMGVLWNKNICICFVRPQRHTAALLEDEEEFSVAFMSEEYRSALKLCGRESGRDTDKLAKCGLSVSRELGVPIVEQAQTVLICKKLYEDEIKENCFLDKSLLSNYTNGDYHRFYVCEIKDAYRKG